MEAQPRRRYRKLRIAWSVAWGVAAVLVCVLWVRSYCFGETLTRVNSNLIVTTLGTESGIFYFRWIDSKSVPEAYATETAGWEYERFDDRAWLVDWWFDWNATQVLVSLPAWFTTLLLLALCMAPWLPYRFSLRTLLIATTLVAVGLGLIVWMVGE